MTNEGEPGIPFGDRLQRHRKRAGMSRPVLGGLVGRSGEWVKALETGRLLTPRLPLLLRLADVLGVSDLADLTGAERLSAATYTKAAHEQLPAIARALATYTVGGSTDEPADVVGLKARVEQTWELWHGVGRQRTAVAGLLPDLLREARTTVRRTEGPERRRALAIEAQVYHLSQLFVSFQPAPELVFLTGDRAMTAAQDADDPVAMAAAAWYLNHIYRSAGEQHEARIQLALDTAQLLDPERNDEERALFGLLHLAVALSYAKTGREGDAWRHWDHADRAATALGDDYVHPWLMFGRGIVDAYTVTMLVDLARGGEAARRADRLELATIPSATRRSFHLIETARAHHQRREYLASVALLRRAHDESPDTSGFNLFTRSAVLDLAAHGGATVRPDAQALARELQLTT
ncbi:MAG TPA: helix-turn-helix transcriptional regulator [Pseudonocardiaceae bacterium]|nr:helix-turn-helix transcriptional regulator [Pseudonocardiaceae bacterium]